MRDSLRRRELFLFSLDVAERRTSTLTQYSARSVSRGGTGLGIYCKNAATHVKAGIFLFLLHQQVWNEPEILRSATRTSAKLHDRTNLNKIGFVLMFIQCHLNYRQTPSTQTITLLQRSCAEENPESFNSSSPYDSDSPCCCGCS